MDKVLIKVIRQLLEALEDNSDLKDRVKALEQWQAQVESVWPEIEEDN